MNKLPEKEKVAFKEEPVSTWTRLNIALYGSYVRRGGLDYPGSVNRSLNLLQQMM